MLASLKEHAVPPCLVLVIDDNLYGLMVALSFFEGFVHMLFLESICWFQREFVMTKVPFKELPKDWSCERLIKTKSIVNQVDQLTKRRRCTERDQVIPWYEKHCQLRFVY